MSVKSHGLPTAARRLTASVRVRSTIAGTVVILVGSVVGSFLLILLLQRTLTATVESNADKRATEVAQRIVSSNIAGVTKDLVENTPEDQVAQVINAQGEVVASSSVRAADRPFARLRAGVGKTVRADQRKIPQLRSHGLYILTARGVHTADGTQTILIASSVAARNESVETLLTYLLFLVPAGGVLVAIGMWVLVGRSLRPVVRITSRVATIRSGRLGDRVPVPDSHDEIARLASTMNEMLERLDTGHRVQRAFVSNASHELRSPLASLTASLDVVGEEPSRERWADTKAVMASEVTRMSRLVEDLLLLAKADDDGLALRSEEVDLDDLVDHEVRRLRAHRRVDVTTSMVPARVWGDRERIAQVIRNIVENAAVAATREVRVGLANVEDGARITVDDDGPGIPKAERGRVFDRFVRLDDSRSRDSGGSGLGLAIVREIVLLHGGSVSIEDSPSGGARVVVLLPRDQPPEGSSR